MKKFQRSHFNLGYEKFSPHSISLFASFCFVCRLNVISTFLRITIWCIILNLNLGRNDEMFNKRFLFWIVNFIRQDSARSFMNHRSRFWDNMYFQSAMSMTQNLLFCTELFIYFELSVYTTEQLMRHWLMLERYFQEVNDISVTRESVCIATQECSIFRTKKKLFKLLPTKKERKA